MGGVIREGGGKEGIERGWGFELLLEGDVGCMICMQAYLTRCFGCGLLLIK